MKQRTNFLSARRLLTVLLALLLLFSVSLVGLFGNLEAYGDEEEDGESGLPPAPESDPEADLESAEDWDRFFETLTLSGDWAADLVTVAETQLGYTESERNFVAVLNADRDGYRLFGWTRYGAWYGHPYGDWCAMFLSFCMYYAGIPNTYFPYDSGTINWADHLQNLGLFRNAWGYTPKPGDLVFFDWEGDYRADHVGLVRSVDPETGTVCTIEGNRTKTVETFEYGPLYSYFMGYGIVPENPLQKVFEIRNAERNKNFS